MAMADRREDFLGLKSTVSLDLNCLVGLVCSRVRLHFTIAMLLLLGEDSSLVFDERHGAERLLERSLNELGLLKHGFKLRGPLVKDIKTSIVFVFNSDQSLVSFDKLCERLVRNTDKLLR